MQIEQGRRVGTTQISSDLLTIGRDPGCDVVLEHARISRLHARIEASENGHVLIDLCSANGTVVAGQRVRGAIRLCTGDSIELAEEGARRLAAGEVDIVVAQCSLWSPIGLAQGVPEFTMPSQEVEGNAPETGQ